MDISKRRFTYAGIIKRKAMNTERLKELLNEEKEFRDKWRKAISELNDLIDPIQEHLRECQYWWKENAQGKDELIVIGDGESYKIKKPDTTPVSYQSHLPYGIDFEEIEVFKLNEKQ